jgi:type IV pilus assembly protein PilM
MFKKILQNTNLRSSLSLLNQLRCWMAVRLGPSLEKLLPASLWPQDPPLLGLAISSQAIQLLWLERRYNTCKVLYYAYRALPAGTIVDRKIKTPEKITKTLKDLLTASACKVKQVAIALPNMHVITKQIHMSADLSEFTLASDIEFEAAHNLSMPMENVSLDYHVLGPSEEDPTQKNVLLIASLNAPIAERVKILEEADLEVKVVDVESYVLQRSVEFCLARFPPEASKEWVVLFDFSADTLSFIALHNGQLVYHQEDFFITDELTRLVIEKYNLAPTLSSYAEWATLVPTYYFVDLFPLIQPLLLKQISYCLQLFASTLFFNKIDYVFLSGDIAMVPGADAWLSKELNMPAVGIANPLQDADFAEGVNQEMLKRQAPSLMRVMGLALRGTH